MGLMLKRQRDGTLRPQWYGVYTENGRRTVVNLGIDIAGKPPKSGRVGARGDATFEATRAAAEEALKKYSDEAGQKGRADHVLERLIEQKTGQTVEHVRIADLAHRWLTMPRSGELTAAHKSGVESAFELFRQMMLRRPKKATFLYEVTTADAGAYMELLRSRYAPKTARDYTVLLRSAFRRFLPAGVANPFTAIVSRRKVKNSAEEVHRKPFTADEVTALFSAAAGDDLMQGLIVAAACTGMRRGDLCRLRWRDVDFGAGMVTVKASKTGEPVEVPIFDELRAVLESRKGNGSEYVFPAAARMLAENPDGLTWRFKKVVSRALGGDPRSALPEPVPASEIEPEALAAIMQKTHEGDRRTRVLDTFRRYAAGQSVRQIEKETGRQRSTAATDLQNVERWIDKRFIRRHPGRQTKGQSFGIKDSIARTTRTTREHGQRSASVRDWHAL
ncbi:MAG: hypothetical protein FJ224_09830, partial [Lentisphaerae bacterium]|nr:hypothetical protein [Lentisphaerota bacterium]